MSNALSIAATTLTLRNILNAVATTDFSALPADARPISSIDVTTLPPDQARPDSARNRINIFLYHTAYNAAWRNADLPLRGRPGESLPPVLPLNLHYLLTVYAEADNELIGQVLLGSAMLVLHDTPLLARDLIATALPLAELDQQFERVRITPQQLSPEDMTGIWSGFQSEYRLSAGYEVGVLLIESARAGRGALPVLRRGSEDLGPQVTAGAAPRLTRIAGFVPPGASEPVRLAKPSAELGDSVVVTGRNFDGAQMVVRLGRIGEEAVHLLPLGPERDNSTVRFTLPPVTDPSVARDWPAGFYTLEMEVTRPDTTPWITNRLTLALAPQVSALAPATQPLGSQPFGLTLTATPQIVSGQRVSILLGDREFVAAPGGIVIPADPDAPCTINVTVDALTLGGHVARLRVEGIDSLPMDIAAALPTFDPAQTLVVSP